MSAEVLGERHPFARALDLSSVLRRQSITTAVALLVSAVSVSLGAGWAWPALIAAAVVQLVLAALLLAAVTLGREHARDLLIDRCDLDVPMLVHERRRLLAPRRRRALAASLEDLVRCARRRDRPSRTPAVYDAFLVRQFASELLTVADDLRAATVDVSGVARVQRLLTIGTSPLYGSASDELWAELARLRADLACGGVCNETQRELGGAGGRATPRRVHA